MSLSAFETWVKEAHVAPAKRCAWHAWHYPLTAELRAKVEGWHASGQLLHLRYWDSYHDTDDCALELKHQATLRMRTLHNHSGRCACASDNGCIWTLTWRDRYGALCFTQRLHEIMSTLKYDYKLACDHAPVNPLSYPLATVYAMEVDSYFPPGGRETNPRWHVDVINTLRYGEDNLFSLPDYQPGARVYPDHALITPRLRSGLCVEADPSTLKCEILMPYLWIDTS
jgi:hypothetical protein